jgi:hypothetical protein
MGFTPDIIVRDRDWPRDLLVVGVHSDDVDLAASAAEVKAYMARKRCPSGLLVSPSHFRVYQNKYPPETPESIEEVGDYPTAHVMGRLPVHTAGPEFEDFVRGWLEELQRKYMIGSERIPVDALDVIEWNVVFPLFRGEVRAAAPAWPWVST